MKKITISQDQEIELTEREEEIYEAGRSHGWDNGMGFGIILCLIIILFMVIGYKLAST